MVLRTEHPNEMVEQVVIAGVQEHGTNVSLVDCEEAPEGLNLLLSAG